MAKPCRTSPTVKERDDPRAEEYFRNSVARNLSMVGTRTLALNPIGAGGIGTFTVTVKGARPNQQQTVQIGVSSTFNTGLVPWGYVSSNETVTVVLYNRTSGSINVPNDTYGVRVMP
jgi:hypothetical protein